MAFFPTRRYGPGAMWQLGDFYMQVAGPAPKYLVGIGNVVGGSRLWVYRLDVVGVSNGIPTGIPTPMWLQLHRTVAPLGGGPTPVPMPVRSDVGASPADVRVPPALPVLSPEQAFSETSPGTAVSLALPPTLIDVSPGQRASIIASDAPLLLLPGEGLVLWDAAASTDPLFGAFFVMSWGVE
jgi:hypothetical protein